MDEKWAYLALGLLGGGVLAGVLLWLSRQNVTTFDVIRDAQGNIVSVQKRTGILARMTGDGRGSLGDFLTT